MFGQLATTIFKFKSDNISNERKEKLKTLIDFIQRKVDKHQAVRLNFICTHNSIRSHLSQVWTQALAFHFNIHNVFCFSGGTEATAVYSQVIMSLRSAGFQITQLSEGPNPVYNVKYSFDEHPITAFSKKYDAGFNPSANFAAILTCTEADNACPFITGAEERIALPFNYPKAFDNTPQRAEKYEETSLQIAIELCYVFSKINTRNKPNNV